jgi:hypothetical protein
VVEYNFYAYRAIEGYVEQTGRGGAGLTGAHYDCMKICPRCLKKEFITLPRFGPTSLTFLTPG